MLSIREIYNVLDNISPFSLQEKWDNSGLLIGDMDREINHIIISLDIDNQLIDDAENNTLFITHHPLIFRGITSLKFNKYPNNFIEKMIKKNISLISLHTNFDTTHLNKYVFESILGFQNINNEDFICKAHCDLSTKELITLLQDKLNLKNIKVTLPKDNISSISLITGAGASFIDKISTDCFLTGDIKYHDAIKAESQNLMTVDIGHYESEIFFSTILKSELDKKYISSEISNSKNPFIYF